MQKSKISIEYCPKCKWLLRAAYIAQELLSTFEDEIAELALIPSQTNGRFTICVEDKIIFDRKQNGGFIDITALKQLVRDIVNPTKALGHSDKKN
jgi:selenoprotein W-related protein